MPYEHLAFHYDALMRGIDYGAYAGYLLSLSGSPKRVLDLACGTGRLTEELCKRGCEVVAVDGSAEMLSVAQSRHNPDICREPLPLFIQQDMAELDLYGTVEAVFCTLDALNYLTDEKQFIETLRRVRLFLEPGGAFVFDLLAPEYFASRDGMVFMADAPGAYCVWSCSWQEPLCVQEITLFARRDGGLWERFGETHTRRAYDFQFVEEALRKEGFAKIRRCAAPVGGEGRTVFHAV
jgi:ubiquinone/menaquinone biosynthesis C-methylase UbiE